MAASTLKNPVFQDETKAREYLEAQRWPDGVICPFCGQIGAAKALPASGALGAGWWHCGDCRKKFTVRVGTLYERSHVPIHKWLYATHLLTSSKKGISSHQLHRMLGVTYKTAWFMSHRIREAMRVTGVGPMGAGGGIVPGIGAGAGGIIIQRHRRLLAKKDRSHPIIAEMPSARCNACPAQTRVATKATGRPYGYAPPSSLPGASAWLMESSQMV